MLEKQFLEEFHLEHYDKRTISKNTIVFQNKVNSEHQNTLQKFKEQFPIMTEFYYDNTIFNSKTYSSTKFENLVGSVIRTQHQNLKFRDFSELIQV